MRPFVWAECAQHIHVNVLPGWGEPQEATASEERVRPRNTSAPFVRVRCAAKITILAHLERRAVHMEPCTWPSQTCFVSLLGFVSFSTYFPIRNQLQLVTLWKGPRCGQVLNFFIRDACTGSQFVHAVSHGPTQSGKHRSPNHELHVCHKGSTVPYMFSTPPQINPKR